MAGSMDDNPPVILFSDDYEFCIVGYPGEGFACYRSREKNIDKHYLVTRLRTIANAIEVALADEES